MFVSMANGGTGHALIRGAELTGLRCRKVRLRQPAGAPVLAWTCRQTRPCPMGKMPLGAGPPDARQTRCGVVLARWSRGSSELSGGAYPRYQVDFHRGSQANEELRWPPCWILSMILRNRAMLEACIVCCHGRRGSRVATWPQAAIHLCVAHLGCASPRYACEACQAVLPRRLRTM